VRILHVVPTYLPAWRHGGPIYAVHGLARALAARGHEVTVFTTDVHGAGRLDVPLGTPVEMDGVTVWYFPVTAPRRLYRSPAMGAALARRLAATDLVHLHSVFLWPTAAAARAARRAGVPYLLAPRGMLVGDLLHRRGWLRKRLWIELAERRNLKRAAGLHVTSALEGEEAARLGLRLPAVHVVPNGVEPAPAPGSDAALSPAVRAALARPPLLLYLGRVSWKKGLDRLIPALAQVPEATLAVAGNDEEGYRAPLERLARETGVAERVLFLGPVHGADKAALLAGAEALVLPSYSENFGNAVLEAMAAGCPVVVTPEVGLAGVVRETGAGLVAAGDPISLGSALRELLNDPERRAEMGRRGAAAATRRFGWATIAERMEEVYTAVLAAGRTAPGTRQASTPGRVAP
jgi:glycosyltransferase involved in cell wall biosynthesis